MSLFFCRFLLICFIFDIIFIFFHFLNDTLYLILFVSASIRTSCLLVVTFNRRGYFNVQNQFCQSFLTFLLHKAFTGTYLYTSHFWMCVIIALHIFSFLILINCLPFITCFVVQPPVQISTLYFLFFCYYFLHYVSWVLISTGFLLLLNIPEIPDVSFWLTIYV